MASEVLTETLTSTIPPAWLLTVPPLENGDCLTRAEFERRYHEMPQVKKAELIKGKVYMGSPVRVSVHATPHGRVVFWLGFYVAYTFGVEFADNATLRINDEDELQPDAALFIDELRGGRSSISDDGYLEGAPELIVEIAASTASYDLHDKLKTYQDNGVQEYVVWSVYEQRIDWFELVTGQYLRLPMDDDGIIRSRVFPGLWLNVNAILTGNLAHVVSDLQQGLATNEHTVLCNV